jgi:hypothetical protein
MSIVWRVLFLEHQPRFQHRQLAPWSIFRHRLLPVCAGYILCLRSLHSSSSCLLCRLSTKSSEPIQFTILLVPVSVPDTRIGLLLLTNPSIQDCIWTSIDSRLHLNITSKSLRLTFAGYVLYCTILYCTVPVYIASVSPDTVSASRNCITSHLKGILLYIGLTFKVPEYQSYIYYYIYLRVCIVYPRSNTVLYCASVNYPRSTVASRDCLNPFSTGIFLYIGFTFEAPECQSYI